MSDVTAVMDQPDTWAGMLWSMTNRAFNKDERLGQAYFNALWLAWPDVAELVRGTDADPFYAETFTDPRFEKFFAIIMPYFI